MIGVFIKIRDLIIFPKKQLLFYSIIILIVLVKMYVVADFLDNNSLPVYDGVMNEKLQIDRYLNFNNDFSFKQRIIQAYYEFKGNPVTSVFNVLVIIINPQMLVNDLDVYLRALFVLLVLLFTLNKFLTSRINFKIAIVFIVFLFPLFNNFRFGLMTYVPDLSSGVLLMCAYLNLMIFLKVQKINYFLIGFSLIFLAVGFRFNFFVYSSIIFLPLIIPITKVILNKEIKKILFYLVFILLFLFVCIFYVKTHFDFFYSYYKRPAVYAETNLMMSLKDIFYYFFRELKISFLWILVSILILNNRSKSEVKSNLTQNLLLIYPFLSVFLFLTFYMNAYNQPHVFSFLFFLLIPVAFVRTRYLNNLIQMISPRLIYVIVVLTVFFSTTSFFNNLKFDYKKELCPDGLKLAHTIDLHLKNSPSKKYFILFDTALEIPLDVYFFRKTHIWNDNQLRFYFTDWHLYTYSKTLNVDEITSYYINQLNAIKPTLIFVNSNSLNLDPSRAIAMKVNKLVGEYVKNSVMYVKVDSFYYNKRLINTYKKRS